VNIHRFLDYQTGNYAEKTESSVLAKTAPGFLDNLNQKLAEQRASQKAFQVRSYINSKVVVSFPTFSRPNNRPRTLIKNKTRFGFPLTQ
jgi:hypothetical protein